MVDARRVVVGELPGEPARGASIFLDVIEGTSRPERLILGALAVTAIRSTLQARIDELERWSPISDAADFPGAA